MKKLIFLFIFFTISIKAQKISFEYDVAGNQIQRILSITTPRTIDPKDVVDIKDNDLLKFVEEDSFSYYPNPVKEFLYLRWYNNNNIVLNSMQIISMNGSIVKTFKNLQSVNFQDVNFYDYPQGMYVLQLFYSNGEEKSIKIIKQ